MQIIIIIIIEISCACLKPRRGQLTRQKDMEGKLRKTANAVFNLHAIHT